MHVGRDERSEPQRCASAAARSLASYCGGVPVAPVPLFLHLRWVLYGTSRIDLLVTPPPHPHQHALEPGAHCCMTNSIGGSTDSTAFCVFESGHLARKVRPAPARHSTRTSSSSQEHKLTRMTRAYVVLKATTGACPRFVLRFVVT